MSGVITMMVLAMLLIATRFLPHEIASAVQDVAFARLEVQSSRERCPQLSPTKTCQWEIRTRFKGEWQRCDEDHAPSGADLPSHRWFQIKPNCRLIGGIPLFLPTQMVYR